MIDNAILPWCRPALARGAALLLALTSPGLAQDELALDVPPGPYALASDGRAAAFVEYGGPNLSILRLWRPGQGASFALVTSDLAQLDAVADGARTVLAGELYWDQEQGVSLVPGWAGGPNLLSPDGTQLVYSGDGVGAPAGAVRWDRQAGTFTILSGGPQGAEARPMGLSPDGRFLAGQVLLSTPGNPALWDPSGSLILLPEPLGGQDSRPQAVTDEGTVAFGTTLFQGMRSMVRWTAAGAELLGRPAGAGLVLEEEGGWVRADGGLAVLRLRTAPQLEATETWVWTAAGGVQLDEDYLASRGFHEAVAGTHVGHQADRSGRRWLVRGAGAGDVGRWVDLEAQVSFSYCGRSVPNSTGSSGRLLALGSSVVDDSLLWLRGLDLPTGQAALPLASATLSFVPMAGGSAGNLCLGGAIGRGPVQVTGADGRFDVELDPAALPTPTGTAAALAGEAWGFQAWYRDGAGVSNFTDGALVLFQ